MATQRMRGCSGALLLWAFVACNAIAATPETPPEPPADATPCMAAIAADDNDRIITICGALIDDKRVLPADRLKALIARGGVYARTSQPDRAIADYDLALKLDRTRSDLFNARGELWRGKGDRPRAIGDFAAAIRLDPQNETARANHKALSLEIEKLGADMALKNMGKGQPKAPLK